MTAPRSNWPDVIGEPLPPSFSVPPESHNRGVLFFDPHGKVICADANVFLLLGVTADLSNARTDEDFHAVLKDCFKAPEEYIAGSCSLKDDPHQIREDVFQLAGSGHRFIHIYTSPLFAPDGDFVGRAEVYSDITKRRETEKAARKAFVELKAAQEQLVQSEKLRAMGEIASGVAHDFNNTLGVVLGNIQLLLRSVQDESARAQLQAAERAAMDGVDTVRRIQEFTRTKAAFDPIPIRLSSIVTDVTEMMRPVWQERAHSRGCNIDVSLDLMDDVVALGHAPEIREVLINIVLNAVQAMPDGGSVRISTGRSKDRGWIRVADTGIGMTEDVRKRVFDPFFTTRGVEGSGLGMSVAFGIIRRHEGSITIDSKPGKGSVVTVFLPCGAMEAGEDKPAELEAEREQVHLAKILVVDDEEMFAEVVIEMLAECGHTAVMARSGAEAIELFKDGQFDMVFTDLGMPQMSGMELAKAIKDMRPGTPVALLTGWAASIDNDELSGSPIDMALGKPVSLKKLSDAVADALAQRIGQHR